MALFAQLAFLVLGLSLLAITDAYEIAPSKGRMLLFRHAHSIGGKKLPGTYSATKCRDDCDTNPKCFAVDYDARQEFCWLHVRAVPLNSIYDRSPTYPLVQYFKQTAVMRLYKAKHSLGGSRLPRAHTADECHNYCVRDARCFAVDYDEPQQSCWEHNQPVELRDILDPNYPLMQFRKVTSG